MDHEAPPTHFHGHFPAHDIYYCHIDALIVGYHTLKYFNFILHFLIKTQNSTEHMILLRMKLIIQKVTRAAVRVDDEIVGQIGRGLCVLAGIHRTDTGWVQNFMSRDYVM